MSPRKRSRSRPTDRSSSRYAESSGEQRTNDAAEATMPPRAAGDRHPWLVWPALLAATLIVYQPAWYGGLLWDDEHHLTRASLRSIGGLWRIWFDLGATQQYYPVSHSAFWLQAHLWGESTLGYHLVNITFHVVAAGLVWRIVRRLRIPGAALAATVFALHPVNAESVAWMSELKNTLSAVGYLGAALAYLHFDERRGRAAYWTALLLFVAAVLAKSVTATLPGALLVVFWWQRGRIDWRRDVTPLAPLFAVGIALGAMTAWIERTLIGAEGSDFQFGFLERILIAARALWFYLAKLAWPSHLTFIYPRWTISASDATLYIYLAGALGLFAALWLRRTRTRAPLAALLFFVVTLGPALGFVNVYPFRFSFVADHFQYLAEIGPIVLASAAIVRTASRFQWRSLPVEAAAIVALGLPLGWLTRVQAHEYADAATLYRATIAKNPVCWLAYNNLGALDLEQRPPAFADAVEMLRTAIRLNPGFPESHNNLGNALAREHQPQLAMVEYREALRLRPDSAEAHNNLGNVLHQLGRIDDAMAEHREALRLEPDYADAHDDYALDLEAAARYDAATHRDLGVSLEHAGRTTDAIAEYETAIRLNPQDAEVQDDLGHLRLRAGQRDEAQRRFLEALRLDPDYAPAHFHLGNLLQESGQFDEAVRQYQAALNDGDSPEIQHNLGLALTRLGRLPEAAAHFEQALKLNPKDESSRAELQRVRAMLK